MCIRDRVTTRRVASVSSTNDWTERDVLVDEDLEEDLENVDLDQVRKLLAKYRKNDKGNRPGTFIYAKIKKLERIEKELESKL